MKFVEDNNIRKYKPNCINIKNRIRKISELKIRKPNGTPIIGVLSCVSQVAYVGSRQVPIVQTEVVRKTLGNRGTVLSHYQHQPTLVNLRFIRASLTDSYTCPRILFFVHFFIARRVRSDGKHRGVFDVFVGDQSGSDATPPTPTLFCDANFSSGDSFWGRDPDLGTVAS